MSLTQQTEGWDSERLIRVIMWMGLASLGLGAVLFVAALAMPTTPDALYALGILGLVVGLILHSVAVMDRWIRQMRGLPRRRFVRDDPPVYKCHSCGYELQGVRGVYCPECGTVRPAPLDDHEAM
ncbi:MAG TPA: hypothetical protein PK400_03540 [Phycisphaerales bacterium]|nr:hypothetical protein [Phycisphaerales bacterium]HRQ75517.1 hypothetical protein [Phycisphaerales bacterium]